MNVGRVIWAVLFVAGCSGSSSGPDAPGSGAGGSGGSGSGTNVACITTSGNGTGCTILEDLSPAGEADATKNCQGTVASSC
jgi:hypothetical protein